MVSLLPLLFSLSQQKPTKISQWCLFAAFGIFTNAAGAKIKWWIDPLGAMLISLGLIVLWGVSITREVG